MPTPNDGEDKQDFLDRCMGDSEANHSFPDPKQRYAFCNSQWDNKDKDKDIMGKYFATSRLKAFDDEYDAFRAGRWIAAVAGDSDAYDWCRINAVPVVKAQSEGIDTSGGNIVPVELMRAIINLREIYGVFRRFSQVVPMASDTLMIARRTAGLSATYTQENTAITESSLLLDSVSLVAKKLSILVRSSTELAEDSAIDLAELLASEVAYAFAKAEDTAGFTGDGTSTYFGIQGLTQLLNDGSHTAGRVAAAGGHNTPLTLDGTDLAKLVAICPGYAMLNAKWYISPLYFGQLMCRIADTIGGGFLGSTSLDAKEVPTFLGFPVIFTPAMPTSTSSQAGKIMICFGDLSLSSTIGSARDVLMEASANRYFDTDQIAWRGSERFDIVNHDLGDNTNAGAVVGLQGTT